MINNFKETKIIPNKDGTFEVQLFGVKTKEESYANIIYPRVTINEIGGTGLRAIYEIECLFDENGRLMSLCNATKDGKGLW